MERRLAAILVTDAVGNSRIMGEDEAGTPERLKAHRKELIDPNIAEHHGRVVKLMGDGASARPPCSRPNKKITVECRARRRTS